MRNYKTIIREMTAWIRDIVQGAGRKGVVVGISGGIDSAVVAALCKQALGDEVLGLIMPCGSDPKDYEDALRLARGLNMETMTVALDPVFSTLTQLLPDGSRLAVANLKPRLRMLSLHYMANTRDYLVVGTGNKSELMIGYFTKYGDNGVDFMPIADMYKTDIFDLARHLDIPQEIIDRPPSAGLWQNQTDEQEMGMSYSDLDHALRALESGAPTDVAPEIMDRVRDMVARSDHKRHLPPIFKL